MKHAQLLKFVPPFGDETIGTTYEIDSYVSNGVSFFYCVSTEPIYSYMDVLLTEKTVVKTINSDCLSYVIEIYDAGKSGISCSKRVRDNGATIDYVYRDIDSGREVISTDDSIYLVIEIDLAESQSIAGEYELQATIGTRIDDLYSGETRLIELTVKPQMFLFYK